MPSVIHNYEPAGTTAGWVAPPGGGEGKPNSESAGTTARRVEASGNGERKLYSEALDGVKKLTWSYKFPELSFPRAMDRTLRSPTLASHWIIVCGDGWKNWFTMWRWQCEMHCSVAFWTPLTT
jgi:hypothetical protein